MDQTEISRHLVFAGIDWGGAFGVAILSTVIVMLCVLLHYEFLRFFARTLGMLKSLSRTKILVLMVGLFVVHLLEIGIFAVGYFYLDGRYGFGNLSGTIQAGMLDYFYFSATTYTTVGYGDVVPLGPLRFLSAVEALCGLLMLGWSASFTVIEMSRFWKDG